MIYGFDYIDFNPMLFSVNELPTNSWRVVITFMFIQTSVSAQELFN